jgi:putative nucleotidyltransferase with HDIG domain
VIKREHTVGLVASALLASLTAIAALSGWAGTWDPALLAILALLVVGADLLDIKFKSLSIAGNFLGLVVAMAVLGPVPAALLGVLSNFVWIARDRPRTCMALATVASYAAAFLAGGFVLRAVAESLALETTDVGFVVPLIAGFAVAHVLNFSTVFVAVRYLDGVPFSQWLREVIGPLLPSEAAMVLLASLIVYAQAHLGVLALTMLAALFFLYLYLYRELTLSQQRGIDLESRTEQLASLQVGVLTAMLRTLSMRDQMTARHSAAVARYAREIAVAHGCTEEEQDLVHTAGLLHDIGKFILPDHILLADTKLGDEDWNLIKMHPYQGSKVVREMEGYGPVADIILCHHERIDGAGYPRGIAGDDIPIYSRMISIADTYDVMTSRDSYRDPVSSDAAIAELRRVSGAQLDGELVEVFISVLESKGVAFRHADDADFEAELQFDKRMREHAAPRELVAAA